MRTKQKDELMKAVDLISDYCVNRECTESVDGTVEPCPFWRGTCVLQYLPATWIPHLEWDEDEADEEIF